MCIMSKSLIMAEDMAEDFPAPDLRVDQLVDLLAQLLELNLAPEHRPGVIANFERTAAIAQLVMEFPIADDAEVAPIFQP
jgi:hypothetical protein